MSGLTQNVSDRTLRAWLTAGPVDKGIGGGLIFFARESSARQGQATWILRYRIATRRHEKVLGCWRRLKFDPLERIVPTEN